MTGKLKQQLILGLLAWGLFAFLPNTAHAQKWLGTVGSAQNGVLGDAVGAQMIRAGGQEAVDQAAAIAGYKSENIKAVSFQDAKDLAAKGSGLNNVSGAANAAAARYKGSDGFFSGVWNVVSGAAQDVFRSSDEISADLEQYRNAETAANIDAAVATAKDIQGDGSNILTGNLKSIPDKLDQLDQAANAVAIYETPEGQKIYMDKNMKSIGGLMDGCVPLPLKLEQSRKCILCPLFVILFNTAQTMSIASYNALATGFKNLLLIGFALYVAFVTLKQVSSFTKQDGPKYISDLLTMSFKILLAYLVLTHVQELYRLILEPLLNAAMEFGGSFLFRSADSNSASSFMSCASASQLGDGVTIATGYYSAGLFAKIDCFVRSVQQELAVATSIGSSLMCVAQNEASHWYGLPDLTMLFSGLIIWCFSWLVCLAFGFYLIDAVVRLGVVGGLMPFLIAAWPFKLTSQYTSTGWKMFMNTFFTFVFLGLVVSVNIELGLQAVTGGEGGYDKIMELVNANEVKPLVEIMSIGLMGLLFLILCCIFGFKLCGEAVSLASQMSGGSGGTIGSHIASLGAGAAKWGAVNTGKAVGRTAKSFGEASGLNDKIRQGKEAVGRKMYNGMAAVGRRLGLKGATGSSGGQGGGGSGGGNGGNGNGQGGNGNATAQNRGSNAAQNRSGQRTPGEAANTQEAATGQAGGAEGTAAAGATANNAQPNGQNGGQTGQSRGNGSANDNGNENRSGSAAGTGATANANSGAQNPESGSGQNTGNAQNTGSDRNAGSEGQPANDGGASAAGPRDNNVQEQANQIVNSSKEKIAAAAQSTAAGKGESAGKPGKVESPNKNGKKDDKKDNAAEKKAKAQIEELQRVISGLETEKRELEKQLRNLGGKSATGNAAGPDDEMLKKLKKLEDDKKKAESLVEALKNQK